MDPSRYPVIPWPRSLEPREGDLALPAGARIGVPEPALAWVAAPLVARGLVVGIGGGDASIAFELRPAADAQPESYRLDVTPAAARVTAPTARGLYWGARTLAQLAPADGPPRIPAVRIDDAPRFGYRGLHLDVGRHFFPVDFVKRYIDLMSLFKLNTFHWHLTEDQGWRLEIERYPRLTEIGAWRKETIIGHARRGPKGYGLARTRPGPKVTGEDERRPEERSDYDATPHGGFYTQAQAREVVAYARERAIDVLPEIEMPGHALAALASYPELGCRPGPFEVRTTWGIAEDVLCPRDATLDFVENVLREVMDIFPGTYVHIGGDEAPKTRWRECADAQAVIRREGLKGEDELQSYFIRRVERSLNANGRRLVGWDEILEGGLAPDATVMSWRGTAGGIAAASAGHDVIMTPQQDLYFDHYQGDPATEPLAHGGMTTLEEVYAHEPVPSELAGAAAARVRGAQGCVWTEYMPTSDVVEYMAYPRALALAEITWSPKDARDWRSFRARLARSLAQLDALGVKYRRPD